MYQKILLAFDGSPDGREALAQAKNLASACPVRRFVFSRS